MEKEEKINFWKISANKDFEMMEFLYKEKRFSYALFFGQLGLEKLLKALYIKLKNESPPFIHDLVKLSSKCVLDLSKKDSDILEEISGFNINARYDDYKDNFYKIATKEYTNKYTKEIGRIKKWLEKQI